MYDAPRIYALTVEDVGRVRSNLIALRDAVLVDTPLPTFAKALQSRPLDRWAGWKYVPPIFVASPPGCPLVKVGDITAWTRHSSRVP